MNRESVHDSKTWILNSFLLCFFCVLVAQLYFPGILQTQMCFLSMKSLKTALNFPWNHHSHIEDWLLICRTIQGRAVALSWTCPHFSVSPLSLSGRCSLCPCFLKKWQNHVSVCVFQWGVFKEKVWWEQFEGKKKELGAIKTGEMV